jgi:Uncharacterized conserved protein
MAKYVDVYLLPIPEENIPAYREAAEKSSKIFLKHGALSYREYVVSDLKTPEGIMPFDKAIELKPGETLVYAAVEFESEERRNEAMKRIFEDEEMHEAMPEKPIFEMNRMIYGGFRILVDAQEK